MRDFFIRIIINALAITVAANFIQGIDVVNGFPEILIVGLIITAVNALLKPILTLLTCPAVILTLGLFILVINGLVLQAAAYFAGNTLIIEGFWPAFWGGIIMAIVNMILESVLGVDDKSSQSDKRKND
ncbi:MAG: phage holin family protein [Chloroflexota bacterium]